MFFWVIVRVLLLLIFVTVIDIPVTKKFHKLWRFCYEKNLWRFITCHNDYIVTKLCSRWQNNLSQYNYFLVTRRSQSWEMYHWQSHCADDGTWKMPWGNLHRFTETECQLGRVKGKVGDQDECINELEVLDAALCAQLKETQDSLVRSKETAMIREVELRKHLGDAPRESCKRRDHLHLELNSHAENIWQVNISKMKDMCEVERRVLWSSFKKYRFRFEKVKWALVDSNFVQENVLLVSQAAGRIDMINELILKYFPSLEDDLVQRDQSIQDFRAEISRRKYLASEYF